MIPLSMGILKGNEFFKIIEIFVTGDVREDRDGEKWLNVIMRKQI